MKLFQTALPGVVLIEPRVFEDERGWFMESFNESVFHAKLQELELPVPRKFVQDNHSCSKLGVLRGLHYQLPPHPQGKLVRVVKGAAFDVAVDIRKDSSTFGQSISVELSSDNKRMLWIPEGFAHGFVALEADTHFLYKTTDYYNSSLERAVLWSDPGLGIEWPLADQLLINAKDATAPLLQNAELD